MRIDTIHDEPPRFVDATSARAQNDALLGGKATQLARLEGLGASVPAWFCLTTSIFEGLRSRATRTIEAQLATLGPSPTMSEAEAAARTIEARILAIGLEERDRAELLRRFDASYEPDARVAVRSSVVGEDSASDSFAGQMDSMLFVARSGLEDAVLRCFASAYGARALLYRKLRGLDDAPVRAAVIVQRMIDGAVSGVVFTADPSSGERGIAIVSAGLGLGEGIVQGAVETDTYRASLATGTILDRTLTTKRSAVVKGESDLGTRTIAIAEAEGSASALSDEQVRAICRLGSLAEARFGVPLDIEWTLDRAGTLHVLQARPITTLANGYESVFDNSNIVESFPGTSLPLTFSFARAGYEAAFRQASRRFGVKDAVLSDSPDLHANMLGLVDGRIYYNIKNWYRLFAQIPGTQRIIPTWEKALGLSPSPVDPVERDSLATLRYAGELATVWFCLARNFVTLDREMTRYLDVLARVLAESEQVDPDSDPHAVLAFIETSQRRISEPFAVCIVNDVYAQQLYGILGKLITRFGLGDEDEVRNELLCGEHGMESVEPVRSILAITTRVKNDADARALFDGPSPAAEVYARLEADPRFATIRAALREHLDRYGDRTLHELKLEVPSLRDDPGFLVTMIRNYLRGGQNVESLEERERAIRQAAEARVRATFSGRPVERALFFFVLDAVRRTVKNRENLRLSRTRAFGMAKRLYRGIGASFVRAGLVDVVEDIFYLTTDEVASVVRGTSVTRDLRALVGLRRREWAEHAIRRPSARIVTHGIAHGAFGPAARTEAEAETDGVLRGTGCSAGSARGKAKIILDPRCDMTIDGEILVAPMTDPGWVFLMLAASGIVAEKGSMLSHTAIIGRELGIPTVVGVPDATRRIASGELVEVRGRDGVVRKIAGNEEVVA